MSVNRPAPRPTNRTEQAVCIHKTAEAEFYADTAPHPLVESAAIECLDASGRYVIHGRWVSKKNGKRIMRAGRKGRRFIASSDRYRRWQRDAILQLQAQRRAREALSGPVRVSMVIWLAYKQRRPDRDNARAGTFDALAKAGVIRNDSQIAEDPLRFERDPQNPRIEVTVTSCEV